jgi:glycosyltransferase involved in cell wall biosynthesis
MRIVIDMQGAQAENRTRGIGRYTHALARAIVRNRGDHEVVLALNGLFPETIQPIRAVFQGLLPQENIRIWHAPGPLNQTDVANSWRRQTAELTREAFLASLNPSVVLVSSLFEGLVDDAVTSIGVLSQTLPTAAILYDLIPLIYRSPYLDHPAAAAWYENKLAHLRRANLLLAISGSSRQEAVDHLGIPADGIVTISTAADSQFRVLQLDAGRQSALRQRYGLAHPYLMYTGGIDPRKNIEGLIRAYAMLPAALRQTHQLAIVCAIQPPDRARLEALAVQHGLARNELVLVGYVPEEDLVALYNLCKLFVFPSWHEGFGLPALEAMACGRAVIGANTSSLPEVIACDEALFNPFDDAAIASKLEQVLTDEAFQNKLAQHGLQQAKVFSWDNSARLAIASLEALVARKQQTGDLPCKLARRPRLAYVSPLPPERSGISDYSAELLPELARHYDIEVVVQQDAVTTPWIKANCPIRTVAWFEAHATGFDRVLYHFGNSSFHQHMFKLLERFPGAVVLHDFFLSGIVAHHEFQGAAPGFWTDRLYAGHGYAAVRERFHTTDIKEIVWKYPCSHGVLQNAQGVIVHSNNSLQLARHWYGVGASAHWAEIPLLRVPLLEAAQSRSKARQALGFGDNDFVVCSFGLLGPSKLNHRLLDAWLASPLAAHGQCVLVFVGENPAGSYGQLIEQTISSNRQTARVRITGWVAMDTFRQYLLAADVGVQLRTLSRGETSAAVLDCMNHGLPTIVNANGSMADLPDTAVLKLPDDFFDAQLVAALTSLWQAPDRRRKLGQRAQQRIRTQHAPRACADQYFAAIEHFHSQATTSVPGLIRAIARLDSASGKAAASAALADAIDRSIQPALTQRQLLVDISELVQRDAKSGIQRVVRSILQEWLLHPPVGYRVEPVYATAGKPGYRYARQFTLRFLGCPADLLRDEPISYRAADVFIGLDLQPAIIPEQQHFYQAMRRQGLRVQFVVYDLLLIHLPHCFPEGGTHLFENWLKVIAQSDGAVCISKAVALELAAWLKQFAAPHDRPFDISWFHLGADTNRSAPAAGLPASADAVLQNLRARPSFLMVGTVEPRKGHRQVLEAFESLWAQGFELNLLIVGKRGWQVDALADQLHAHPQLGKRLFWLEGISDEYLAAIYADATCLIAASEGEGFGLPLIEAAQHKLAIVARDIPVFREVAGQHAFYFAGAQQADLAEALKTWLQMHAAGLHPRSDDLPSLTWQESAAALEKLLLTTSPTD